MPVGCVRQAAKSLHLTRITARVLQSGPRGEFATQDPADLRVQHARGVSRFTCRLAATEEARMGERRDIRLRFEQWALNPSCVANTIVSNKGRPTA